MSDMFNVLFSLAKDNNASSTPVASPGSSNRENLITTVYKQHRTRAKILEPYRRLKNALKNMQDEYLQSKDNNVFLRYNNMKHMIHEVILLEKQYWQLVDIPPQEVSESPNTYVLKIINLLDEKGGQPPAIKSGGIASLLGATMINVADRTKDQNLHEQIRTKSTDELRKECDRLYTELYKLIRKYLGLRRVVQDLTESFQDTRFYPIVPRYPLLKTMIKRVLRAPAFAEICHEEERDVQRQIVNKNFIKAGLTKSELNEINELVEELGIKDLKALEDAVLEYASTKLTLEKYEKVKKVIDELKEGMDFMKNAFGKLVGTFLKSFENNNEISSGESSERLEEDIDDDDEEQENHEEL
uniref:Uncharacterized protein n=1 Tax=Panagrolaimus sp. ES5 TaxID=591445 RepID=A0AC34FGI0_9BILA